MARGSDGGVVDRLLDRLQRTSRVRGVLGPSRLWFWVFVASWLARRTRRVLGRAPTLVFRSELRPGQAFQVSHLDETDGGRKLRRRR